MGVSLARKAVEDIGPNLPFPGQQAAYVVLKILDLADKVPGGIPEVQRFLHATTALGVLCFGDRAVGSLLLPCSPPLVTLSGWRVC